MQNIRQKFITDTLVSFIPSLIQYAAAFVIMLFLVKYLGATGYGIYSQFTITLSFICLFVRLNLGFAMSRFLSGEKNSIYISRVFSTLLLVIIFISIISALGILTFRNLVSDFLFKSQYYIPIVIYLAVILLVQNISAENMALLKARRFIKELSLVESGYFLLMATIVILSSTLTKNIFWVIGLFVFVEIAMLIVTSFLVINKTGFRPKKPSFPLFSPLLKFGAPLLITNLGGWFVQLSDRYFINYYRNISEVGVYSFAYGIACFLTVFWLILDNVLFIDLSDLHDRGHKKELEKRFERILKYGIAVSLAGVIGLSILAGPIIKILSSEEFMSGLWVLVIVSVAILFYGIFMQFSLLLNVLKKVKVLNSMWIMMAILNIILNILFIPRFGMIGAAVATLISFLIGMIVIIIYIRPYFRIQVKKSWIAKIVFSSIFMGCLISIIPVFSVLTLIFAVLVGMIVYGATLILLKFYDKQELLLLKSVFKRNN